MGRIQYTVCRVVFITSILFLLGMSIANAGVYVVEHKEVFDEIRELQIRKQERYKITTPFNDAYNEEFRKFKAKRSDWRRIIDNRYVVGSKYLTGHEYVIGYDERYDKFFVRDTGIVTERGFKTGRGWTAYEIYSVDRNKNLEAMKKLEMFNSWREKEQEEKEKEWQREER